MPKTQEDVVKIVLRRFGSEILRTARLNGIDGCKYSTVNSRQPLL